MGADVEKMETKGDVKGLIKALRDKDETIRGKAVAALDKIGCKPSDDTGKAYYFAAKREWDELTKLGKPAIEALILCLRGEEVVIRVKAALALGEIGDVKAIEPLVQSIYGVGVDLDAYHHLMPVVAEALTRMGEPAPKKLTKILKNSRVLGGLPIASALCDGGYRRAKEVIVDWVFREGVREPEVRWFNTVMSNSNLIRLLAGSEVLPKLLGDYAYLILNIFSWRPAADRHVDVSTCREAIQGLCRIKSPVSSNILHKVAKIYQIYVSMWVGSSWEDFSFKFGREIAQEELKRRGKPRYNPSAYLGDDAWRL